MRDSGGIEWSFGRKHVRLVKQRKALRAWREWAGSTTTLQGPLSRLLFAADGLDQPSPPRLGLSKQVRLIEGASAPMPEVEGVRSGRLRLII